MSIQRIFDSNNKIASNYLPSVPFDAPTPPLTGPLIGKTTSPTVGSGIVGEYISNIYNINALTSGGTTSVSINTLLNNELTGGDWLIWGNLEFEATNDGVIFTTTTDLVAQFSDYSSSNTLFSRFQTGGTDYGSMTLSLLPIHLSFEDPADIAGKSLALQAVFGGTNPVMNVDINLKALRIR